MSRPWQTASLMILCAFSGFCARFPWEWSLQKPLNLEPEASASASKVVAKTSAVTQLRGPVMLTGGTFIDAMGEEFVKLAGGRRARIVVIPTAWEAVEEEGFEQFYEQWQTWQPASIEVLHTRDRQVANQDAFVQKLRTATGVVYGRQSIGARRRLSGHPCPSGIEASLSSGWGNWRQLRGRDGGR